MCLDPFGSRQNTESFVSNLKGSLVRLALLWKRIYDPVNHSANWDPKDPECSRGSSGTQRILWDSEDPVGFRGSGGIQRIRWDPEDLVGSRGSGGIHRVRWDAEDPVGSRGSSAAFHRKI